MSASMVGRIKQWLKEFVEKAKALLGLKSDAAVIRALDSLIKSDGEFIFGNKMLLEGENDYENIQSESGESGSSGRSNTGLRRDEAQDSGDELKTTPARQASPLFGKIVTRAARRYADHYAKKNVAQGSVNQHAGESFGPLKNFIFYKILEDGVYYGNILGFYAAQRIAFHATTTRDMNQHQLYRINSF